MGSIQDITKLIRKGPELISKTNSMKLNRKSIVAGAKDATFQFPFLISDSNSIDMASATVQLFDRVYAEYTKTWISLNAMYDVTLDPTPTDYLKKIHQNVKFEMANVTSYEDAEYLIEGVYNGNCELYMNEDKTYGVIFNKANTRLKNVVESNQENLKAFLSDLDLTPFNFNSFEAGEGGNDRSPIGGVGDLANAIIDASVKSSDEEKRKTKLADSDRIGVPKMGDRDVKKANDVMPYAIQVRLVAVNDKKEFVQFFDLVVGVKATMHLIPSQEMVDNIGRALQNRSLLFKTLRWTTGEISLIKDILLNINDIKEDAIARQKKNPYFSTLKKLRRRHLTIRNFTVPTVLIPNATIAISRTEVDELKDNFAIDVMDVTIAKKLIDSLFLMAFVVLDEGSDTVSILYNETSMFETYSIDVLERENKMSSKQLNRAIGTMLAG